MRFKDRADAGRKLAQALDSYANQDGVVYALPRGGVVLGVEVARALRMPLDLLIPRKLGHPLQPEYAIGAVVDRSGYAPVCVAAACLPLVAWGVLEWTRPVNS